ncbi:DUF1523 domain-containing protein [Pelagivirga sediminicola]|uniref:DUF1523 domain-containing protein n=1 Tax=Pelagivirga sediminicola TaxID=2170575 RepID=A0A2T7G5I5_9RHOB|nr:DUF1523 family protein [Pelagivirga sediminicola]PVA09647.1 DUF1523 domain-containing protein [Pelagivirga sediminicola]
MVYVKWVFWGVFWVAVIAFLHYTLPQHDIARITDTYEKRVDFGENSIFWANSDSGNAAAPTNRDVFFIQAFRTNDKPMIYRNEDTGWGWPPYFKFDTSNLQAEASDLMSKRSAGSAQWVSITHYGWRNEFLSIFPNAISVRPVAGPDVRIIPWFNIILLTLLAALAWGIWARWKKYWSRREKRKFDEYTDGWG